VRERVGGYNNDVLRECYAVSGLSSIDEIPKVLTKYNKQNHLKLIMMEKNRDLKESRNRTLEIQNELKSTSKSLLECSKDIDPPGFSDVASIETCSSCYKNYLKREKKRQKVAMYRAASASGCASPSTSAAISSRRPTSEIEGEN